MPILHALFFCRNIMPNNRTVEKTLFTSMCFNLMLSSNPLFVFNGSNPKLKTSGKNHLDVVK
jgi:hypothetical protein